MWGEFECYVAILIFDQQDFNKDLKLLKMKDWISQRREKQLWRNFQMIRKWHQEVAW